MMNEELPGDLRLAPDARALLGECCAEFVSLLGSEANDACEKAGKSTIAPEHVLAALGVRDHSGGAGRRGSAGGGNA